MARSRNIKPAFFLNEELVELPFRYRLLFIGLWTLADREGRLEDRPKRIKMALFPADDVDVDGGLDALQAHGFLLRYVVAEKRFIQIANWKKHQQPHIKERASEIPPPNQHRASTVLAPDKHGASPPDSFNLIPDSLIPTTTPSEPPTEEEPVPTPPTEPARSSCDFKSEKRVKPQPVADTLLHGTVTQDELIFSDKLTPIEVTLAYRLVCLFTLLDAQQLLDELAYRLNARHNPVASPIAFLRALCERHKTGTFLPSGALQVQAAREAARRQTAREAASRQQAPRGGGGDPPRKVPTAEIANLRGILRPHRAENVP